MDAFAVHLELFISRERMSLKMMMNDLLLVLLVGVEMVGSGSDCSVDSFIQTFITQTFIT